MRLSLTLTLLASLFAPSSARAQTATPAIPLPPAESLHLSNGLRVLLAPDPGARLVSIAVSYATGAADDPNGRRGLSHLATRVAARRTRHVADVMRTLEAAGGWSIGASTSLDTTTYAESVPPERLETALWVESDRMAYRADAIEPKTFLAERELVRGGDRWHTVDGTVTSAWASLQHELYPDWHPYSAANDGAVDLDDIRPDDVRAFLDTWYVPGNATLAIAGRFDRDATLALVKRYFETLPSVEPPARPKLPQWSTPSMLLALSAPILSDQIVLAWRTPAFGEREDAALDLAGILLAEHLQRTLVAAHRATVVQVRQKSARDESIFYVTANVAPRVTPSLLIGDIQAAIDELAAGASPEEMAHARDRLRYSARASMETTWGRARRLVSLARTGIEPGPGFDWGFGQYDRIHEADLARAVTTWLGPAHRVVTALIADSGAPREGSLLVRDEVSQ